VWLEQQRRSLVSLAELTRKDILAVFRLADELLTLPVSDRLAICEGKTLATIFLQPSTRTRLSFESAMLLVGGTYISFGHPEMTKTSAGETFEDTVRVMSGYADVLVVRHARDDAAAAADALSAVPVINAGCGTLEHPTQALTDLYTIHNLFGSIDGLTIGLMGDLRTQRTINSLAIALSRFSVNVHLICHPELNLRPETASYLGDNVVVHSTDSLADVLAALDVLYIIRIDRLRTAGPDDYACLRGSRRLTAAQLAAAKPTLAVLNPLPRDDELAADVDSTIHARYFHQAHLGRPLRAALLALMLGAADHRPPPPAAPS